MIGNPSAPTPCCSSPLPWGFFWQERCAWARVSPHQHRWSWTCCFAPASLCCSQPFPPRTPLFVVSFVPVHPPWASPDSPEPLHSLHAPRGRSSAHNTFGRRVYFDCGAAISQARDICNILEGRKQQLWPQSMFLTSES